MTKVSRNFGKQVKSLEFGFTNSPQRIISDNKDLTVNKHSVQPTYQTHDLNREQTKHQKYKRNARVLLLPVTRKTFGIDIGKFSPVFTNRVSTIT